MDNNTKKLSGDSGAEPSEVGFYPGLDRFSAFSDGVFAIAITLLVLELPVPPADEALVPALLAILVERTTVTQAQADTFADVHDELIEAGLMR